MNSPAVYNLVTKHWPKIATAIVVAIGLLEFMLNSINSSSTLEWYFLAWGSLTGALWFIFDIAEKSTPRETSTQLSNWIQSVSLKDQFRSLPDRFAALFDLIFGSNHYTLFCFRRSVVVSIIASWFCSTLVYSLNPNFFSTFADGDSFGSLEDTALTLGFFGVIALGTNLIPDYISLLQTRYMMNLAKKGQKLSVVLALDAILTGAIFIVYVSMIAGMLTFIVVGGSLSGIYTLQSSEFWTMYSLTYVEVLLETFRAFSLGSSSSTLDAIVLVTFITTFFTSIWLWLYMLSAQISRALLQLNEKMGFLIRVVDVEAQPFRSLGFISVVIVSLLFIPGIPFVIWN